MGGAINRVGPEETAFPHRDSAVQPGHRRHRVRRRGRRHPHGLGARHMGRDAAVSRGRRLSSTTWEDEGADRVKSAYGAATYARLAAIKGKYDPHNLFRVNQNITPA